MSLNLDPVGKYLSQYYSSAGRPAQRQAQILRSLILFALWAASGMASVKTIHGHAFFLPTKTVKNPKKVIGPDGKLIEPEPDIYATKDMVERILKDEVLSDGKQDVL